MTFIMMDHTKFIIPALLSWNICVAAPFTYQNARSMAMGDTGVASAKIGSAGLFNPALLSNNAKRKINHIILPNLGIAAFIDPDAVQAFTDIQKEQYIDNMSKAINHMNSASNDGEFLTAKQNFTKNTKGLNNDLNDLNKKSFKLNTNAFAAISIPNNLGFSIFLASNAHIETTPMTSECDNIILSGYIDYFEGVQNRQDMLNSITATSAPTIQCAAASTTINILTPIPNALNPISVDITNPTEKLSSEFFAAGVTVTEIGASLAYTFNIFGQDIAVGISPKIQQIISYYGNPDIHDLEDKHYKLTDKFGDHEKKEDDFNIDVGITSNILSSSSIVLGLTIKNLMNKSYTTATSNSTGSQLEFQIKHQVRAGITWTTASNTIFAVDLDLTTNDPYFIGDETQFIGFGAEWNIVRHVYLRAGLRSNLSDKDDQLISAGIGFNIIAAYINFGMQAGKNNRGASFQLGMTF